MTDDYHTFHYLADLAAEKRDMTTRDPELVKEDEREPDPVVFQVFDEEESFELETARDDDQNRVIQISSKPGKLHRGFEEALLLDKDDAQKGFKFFYEWLRFDNSVPKLELFVDPNEDLTEICIQAPDARPIILSFDVERQVYAAFVEESGAWVEKTSVTAKESKQMNEMSCPVCQGGPIFPDARGVSRFDCGHCDASFTLHRTGRV